MRSFILFFVILIAISTLEITPVINAEDDKKEDEKNDRERETEREEDDEENDQERENEGENEEELQLGSGINSIILYGTIAAIIAAISYSGFKIITSRRKTSKS